VPDPVTIKKLRETTAALRAAGIHTLEDLRLAIGKNLATGIAVVSRHTGASQALLVALLITEAKDDAGKQGRRELLAYWRGLKTFRAVLALSRAEINELWKSKRVAAWRESRDPVATVFRQAVARPRRLLSNWRRHWLDVLIILLPLILVLLVLRANSINKNNLHYVAAATTVPAFHRISNEVENKSAPAMKGAFTNIDQVRDRYTLATIPAGAILEKNQILSARLSEKMQGRKILSVPIRTGNYSPTLATPVDAIMVLSPRDPSLKATSSTIFEVIALRIEGSGETRSAVVALPEDSFNVATLLLGSHDVFLSQTVR